MSARSSGSRRRRCGIATRCRIWRGCSTRARWCARSATARDWRPSFATFFGVPVGNRGVRRPLADPRRRRRTHARPDGARAGRRCGRSARRVWDHQRKFRIHLGPLTLAQYEAFLPERAGRDGVRRRGAPPEARGMGAVLPLFRARLGRPAAPRKGEVPALKLGVAGQLGWTTWLGTRASDADADDLCLDGEMFVERERVA